MIDALLPLVREVGAALLRWRDSGGTAGHWEGTQFHAQADAWAHRSLCDGLARIAPDIPVVSEEAPEPETNSGSDVLPGPERYWIVDPIDGTASYAGGFPGFVTQLALIENGKPSLALAFAPAHAELFVAERGRGAFRNDVRLRTQASDSPVLVDNTPEPRGIAADLYRDLSFAGYLESGSIGLKICRVADGGADLFFKAVSARDWDLAAPQLILEEAGGCLFDADGQPIRYGRAGRRHAGIVAAANAALARRVVSWHEAYRANRTTCTKGNAAT